MQVGMVGLGRMGGAMVQRLLNGGHECVVFDAAAANFAVAARSLAKDQAYDAALCLVESENEHFLDGVRTGRLGRVFRGRHGFWEIEPEGSGTRYTARARHWTDEALEQHRAMGFEAGWGACADQLKALCES